MKKQLIVSFIGGSVVVITALILVLTACSKKDEINQAIPKGNLKTMVYNSTCNNLIAGQYTLVGQVCITDVGDQFHVEYIADANFSFTEIHFWYGIDYINIPKNKKGNPIPGQFPYTFTFTQPMDYFDFYVPFLSDYTCPGSFYVAAHSVFGTETAWGQGSPIVQGNGNWGMYYQATPPCPDDNTDVIECESFQYETAFGGNTAGNGNAWWYYYENNGAPQDIWADQNFDAGYVIYDGTNINIYLEDGWLLSLVNEPVKIQGYTIFPTKRPAAGLFTTYKGDLLSVPVPNYSYYVIHLDLRKCLDE